MTVQIIVNTDRLNRILRNLAGNTRDAVRKVAFKIEGEAKENARQQHVWDTGALVNSIYTEISGQDNFASVEADVHEANPDAIVTQLPTPEKMTAHVGPSVHYAIYHEFGTRLMSARPYLGPAVETVAGELERNPDVFTGVVTDDSR